ncbi:Crp/Fnr family transcriptional regulator [Roseitranquillus sediminis]|uniref:Crp/Fnr family transcriptional regulator n=1 Tax=Roseitranquillus sediminis TaxID=2809051 RepID=UPI001D0C889C|nr:Crp/Fnr family transcriptional regulator [Roseitranquillus sediminis]
MSAEEVDYMQEFRSGFLEVERGTSLFEEGASSHQLYTVIRGMGLRYKTLPDGSRQVLNFVFPGDFLGLQSGLMLEMGHSVEATTQMSLCVFERKALWRLFRDQPSRALDITWLAATSEHFLGDALTAVGRKDATQRVAWALVRIWGRCEALGLTQGMSCPMPFRQQDLADALGLSLVHTNKTLGRLRKRQLADWTEGRLQIMDLDTLAEIGMVEEVVPAPRPLI